MSTDLTAVPVEHRAQTQALLDLLAALETDTLAPHATADEIMKAQELIGADIGWADPN